MIRIHLRAPAKLNLTLEVLGRRADGYHEIRSVVATCSLWDDVCVQEGSGLLVTADEDYDAAGMPAGPGNLNTVETALAIMVEERSRLRGERLLGREAALQRGLSEVGLRLHKRIPAAAGLGGGSSDGTAALIALDHYWGLSLGAARLQTLAARIGSDCAFFVRGGLQYVRGRGEILKPLPPIPALSLSLCIVKPAVILPAKTAHLYRLLRSDHFSEGGQSDRLVQALSAGSGAVPDPTALTNVFDHVAETAYGDQRAIRTALAASGALAVHLCGAGPALYGVFPTPTAAQAVCACLIDEGFTAWTAGAPAP